MPQATDQHDKEIQLVARIYRDSGIPDPMATQLATAYVTLLYLGTSGILRNELNGTVVESKASFTPDTIPPDGP